jgi:hypothetical protein
MVTAGVVGAGVDRQAVPAHARTMTDSSVQTDLPGATVVAVDAVMREFEDVDINM